MRSPQPHCEVALMLCESLIHLLVEEGVLTKAKAIEAIETVAELTHEIAESAPSVTSQIAVDLVEDLAASFALQDSAPSNANLESVASARSPRRNCESRSPVSESPMSESLGGDRITKLLPHSHRTVNL
jgi:hypothetical protein